MMTQEDERSQIKNHSTNEVIGSRDCYSRSMWSLPVSRLVPRLCLWQLGGQTPANDGMQAHGWTEEYCRYLDYLTTIDISYTALWHQRDRYESTITLACNDEDRQAEPMKARKDFRLTTKILASLRQEQGRQNSFIPKNGRTRPRPFD